MEVGLYGKLPSHGDFLRRRVSDAFLTVWDEWLQQSVAASREALGERWLDVFLTSPVWRFVCDAGVCGEHSYAGLFAPSVDRVGRYFPLTLVWQVPKGVNPLQVIHRGGPWFSQAEQLILETFSEEHIDLETFDSRLLSLHTALDRVNWRPPVELSLDDAMLVTDGTPRPWQVAIDAPTSFPAVVEQLLYARLRRTHAPLTVMWTEGSGAIEPSCLMLKGLPAPTSFTALLDGRWREQRWDVVRTSISAPAASPTDTLVEDVSIQYSSCALSDVGKVRSINQDAFIERTDIGLWAVADGMGGHSKGEVASRMTCDALAQLPVAPTISALVDSVTQALAQVNSYLRRSSARAGGSIQSGSTVVVLVTRGDRFAVIWAGDSRRYRIRDVELAQLTKDHSEGDESAAEVMQNAITRAIGGDDQLEVEVSYGRIRPGDRFLLCSDGLNKKVSDVTIAERLRQRDPDKCVRSLVDSALNAGGDDNVTALIVDAHRIVRGS